MTKDLNFFEVSPLLKDIVRGKFNLKIEGGYNLILYVLGDGIYPDVVIFAKNEFTIPRTIQPILEERRTFGKVPRDASGYCNHTRYYARRKQALEE